MTTPRHGFTELPTGQNASPESMNEAIRQVEQGANFFVVKDKDLATPPGSPADGDAYIVAGSPTGAWTGHAKSIAVYVSTAWQFIVPLEGDYADAIDEDVLYRYSGSAWAAFTVSGIPTEASDAEVYAGSSTTKFISPRRLYTAAAPVALTSSATITPDGDNGFNFTLTLAHNATLANPSNFKEGQSGLIKITQDGTGSRTMAYGTNWKFPSGAPVLSTAAGAIDLLAYHVWSGGTITATLTKAYSS